jgi:hypothetical protein
LRRKISLTCAGFALPWLRFITCPTSALNAFSLPAVVLHQLRVRRERLVDDLPTRRVEICFRPASR